MGPFAVTLELKVAAPSSDISNVSAVISEPPSSPLNRMSLSWIVDSMSILFEPSAPIRPNSVPAFRNSMSAPPASSLMSPATSMVKSPEDRSISVPLIEILSTDKESAVSAPAVVVPNVVEPNVLYAAFEVIPAANVQAPPSAIVIALSPSV